MAAKKKKKKSTPAKKPKPPPKMIIRRNAAPALARPAPAPALPDTASEDERLPMTRRIEAMGGSHVAAGGVAGVLGTVAGVIMVGQGWIGPKTTAGILMGTGAVMAAAGWAGDADHWMVGGVGLTAAGAASLTTQLAVEGYEAYEKRAEEKQADKEEQDRARRLTEARALLEQEAKQKRERVRNGRRIVVVDANGEEIEHPAQASA